MFNKKRNKFTKKLSMDEIREIMDRILSHYPDCGSKHFQMNSGCDCLELNVRDEIHSLHVRMVSWRSFADERLQENQALRTREYKILQILGKLQ